MVPSGIRVVETVSWAPAARDGSRSAAIRLDFPHHPLTLRGTLSLVRADGGTRATVAGQLRAAVPFMAGRIERMAAKLVVRAITIEHGVGRRLARRRRPPALKKPPYRRSRVRRPAWRSAVGTVTIAVVLSACTATHEGQGHRVGPSSAASPSSTASSSDTARPSCPASYLPPRADRPRVALTFAVAPDLATVRGTERITFTPDRPITELVFRLTANTAPTAATGTKIVVTSAHGGPRRRRRDVIHADGADPSTQGGLLHIPFRDALLRAPK